MVTQRQLAFHPISPSGCNRCRILLLGLCFLHRGTTASRHYWHSCTGWRWRSASSLSWLFWYTAYTRQLRLTLLRNSISHLLSRLISAPLCFDIIACCPTHTYCKHRRSSFPGRRCPTVEHCHWTPLNILKCLCSDCHFGHYNRSFYNLLTKPHWGAWLDPGEW